MPPQELPPDPVPFAERMRRAGVREGDPVIVKYLFRRELKTATGELKIRRGKTQEKGGEKAIVGYVVGMTVFLRDQLVLSIEFDKKK